MNQLENTQSTLPKVIHHILAQKMGRGSMFTAYDVLKEVRDQGEPACYPQVETIVEMFMDREPDYTHTFRLFDNGCYWATVYHPQGTDAHSYDPDRQLFDLPEFMTYAEAAYLNPTRGEIKYLFKDQGWYGIARLFYGYENEAMEIIDPDGAYWGPEHAKDLKTGDLVETFYWLKDGMLHAISKAEYRRAEEQRYLALWDEDDDEDDQDAIEAMDED